MLQLEKIEQVRHIATLLGEDFNTWSIGEFPIWSITTDKAITFDQMAEIVDYVRSCEPIDGLFEECWVAYRRKGSKKKAREQWKKLNETEKKNILQHIKAYVSSNELQYQRDFERYIRDKVFKNVVFNGNKVMYDPSKLGKGENVAKKYTPSGHNIYYDELRGFYYYTGLYFNGDMVLDGYEDEERPHGAKLCLNNGRGVIEWNGETLKWEKVA